MVHVPRLQHAKTAQLLLCLCERAIGDEHLAVLPAQGLGASRTLQGLPAIEPVPLLLQLAVIGKTFLDRSVLFIFRNRFPAFLCGVSQANEFHSSLLAMLD